MRREKQRLRMKETHRVEGMGVRNREGERGSSGAVEQEKTSAPWEHSDGLSKARLCSHCWSDAQN